MSHLMHWETGGRFAAMVSLVLLMWVGAGCRHSETTVDGPEEWGCEENPDIDTPEEDEDWPDPCVRSGNANPSWAQVRVGEDHYYQSGSSVHLEIHEGRPSDVSVVGTDEEGRTAGVKMLQNQGWPVDSEIELPQQEFGERPNTGVQLTSEDDSEIWGFPAETGRIYDVEVDRENGTIAGKFEATLLRLRRPERYEPRVVEGAFRGTLSYDCAYRTSETSWTVDHFFESEFCQQYEFLLDD